MTLAHTLLSLTGRYQNVMQTSLSRLNQQHCASINSADWTYILKFQIMPSMHVWSGVSPIWGIVDSIIPIICSGGMHEHDLWWTFKCNTNNVGDNSVAFPLDFSSFLFKFVWTTCCSWSFEVSSLKPTCCNWHSSLWRVLKRTAPVCMQSVLGPQMPVNSACWLKKADDTCDKNNTRWLCWAFLTKSVTKVNLVGDGYQLL